VEGGFLRAGGWVGGVARDAGSPNGFFEALAVGVACGSGAPGPAVQTGDLVCLDVEAAVLEGRVEGAEDGVCIGGIVLG